MIYLMYSVEFLDFDMLFYFNPINLANGLFCLFLVAGIVLLISFLVEIKRLRTEISQLKSTCLCKIRTIRDGIFDQPNKRKIGHHFFGPIVKSILTWSMSFWIELYPIDRN